MHHLQFAVLVGGGLSGLGRGGGGQGRPGEARPVAANQRAGEEVQQRGAQLLVE